MTEELKKQAIAEDAAVAETVEETGATPGLDEAAKANPWAFGEAQDGEKKNAVKAAALRLKKLFEEDDA